MKFLPIVILAFFMSSCGKDIDPSPSPELKKPYELSDDVAKQWNALFIDISRFTTGYRPPNIILLQEHIMGYICLQLSLEKNMLGQLL